MGGCGSIGFKRFKLRYGEVRIGEASRCIDGQTDWIRRVDSYVDRLRSIDYDDDDDDEDDDHENPTTAMQLD